MIIPAMFEKFSFAIAVFALFRLGRVASMMVGLASVDLIFGLLFAAAFLKTKKE
jgi:hypothetical protein